MDNVVVWELRASKEQSAIHVFLERPISFGGSKAENVYAPQGLASMFVSECNVTRCLVCV